MSHPSERNANALHWQCYVAMLSVSVSVFVSSDAYQGEAKSEKRYIPCAQRAFVLDSAGFGKRACV